MLQIWPGYRTNMEGNMTEIWYFTFLAADTQSLRHHTLTNNASHCYLRRSISAFAKKRNCKKSELRWGRYIKESQKRTEMRLNIDQTLQVCKNHCKKSEPAPWDHYELVQNKQNFENGFMCHVLQKIFSLCVSGNAKSKKSSNCVLRNGVLITLLKWQVLKNSAGKSAAWAMVCHEICNNRWG